MSAIATSNSTQRSFPLTPLSIGEMLDRAVILSVQNAAFLIALGLIFDIPNLLFIGHPLARTVPTRWLLVAYPVAILTVGIFWSSIAALVLSGKYREGTVSVLQALAITYKRLPAILGLTMRVLGISVLILVAVVAVIAVLTVLAWGAGIRGRALGAVYVIPVVAAIVPFVALLVMAPLAMFEILVRHTRAGEAWRRSREIVFSTKSRRRSIAIMGVCVALTGASFGVSFVTTTLLKHSSAIANTAIDAVLAIALGAVQYCFLIVAWYDWRVRYEGLDLEVDLAEP